MHHELELMVEAGLTPMEALVASTRRAAEMMKQEDVFGTIEPGKRADLLVHGRQPSERHPQHPNARGDHSRWDGD
jgi:imidazolonepropionase-like amidohydrolase